MSDRPPDYPQINVSSRFVRPKRKEDLATLAVTIGRVSFYMHDGILVRLICGDINLTLNGAGLQNLFPSENLGRRVGLNELKFQLVRLLGEQSMQIVEPYIDKALGLHDK